MEFPSLFIALDQFRGLWDDISYSADVPSHFVGSWSSSRMEILFVSLILAYIAWLIDFWLIENEEYFQDDHSNRGNHHVSKNHSQMVDINYLFTDVLII